MAISNLASGGPAIHHLRRSMGLFGSRRKKHGLYYLLPGMTRANRDKRRRIFRWALVVGILAGGVMGSILWFMNR